MTIKKHLLPLVLFLFLAMNVSAEEDITRGYIVKVGDIAPDFSIETTDGNVVKLSSLRGKVVMLQFTASWCGVCRKEMPHIEADIWQKYKSNKEFALFAIDREETKDKIKLLVDFTKITYPVLMDKDGGVFTSYAHSSAGITRNVLVDREGRIIFMTRLFNETEFATLCQKIDEELKK